MENTENKGNSMINADNGLAINTVVSRQMQEVQAMVIMAKKFPRDIFDARKKIKDACSRTGLAQTAQYTYPRGGQQVSGPSIRLAEAVAQAWGNIDYGIIELKNVSGVSEMMAYAWDLETNVRRSMIFSVKHERDTRSGKTQLTDNRDIYEMTANMGARRVRACILGVIPQDITDEAVKECQRVLREGEGQNFRDSVQNMLAVFEKSFHVSREQIEEYIGYSVVNFDTDDLVNLKGVYDALKDGVARREDYFTFKKETVPDPLAPEEKKDEDKK